MIWQQTLRTTEPRSLLILRLTLAEGMESGITTGSVMAVDDTRWFEDGSLRIVG